MSYPQMEEDGYLNIILFLLSFLLGTVKYTLCGMAMRRYSLYLDFFKQAHVLINYSRFVSIRFRNVEKTQRQINIFSIFDLINYKTIDDHNRKSFLKAKTSVLLSSGLVCGFKSQNDS